MDALSDEFYEARKRELVDRVKPKRYTHIEGVADTAVKLARVYGVDVKKARLAGILHDWDKGYRNNAIRERARSLGLEEELTPWVMENMPEVLHGATAAAALAQEYPEIPDDVIHAIKVHTLGCLDPSPLDNVIYIADALEPSRKFEEADRLRAMIGEVSLDELAYEVYKFWLKALIDRETQMHPDTITIWNSMVGDRANARKARFD